MKLLQEMTKEELIEVVQDFQEAISEIEGHVNGVMSQLPEIKGNGKRLLLHLLQNVRKAISIHIYKEKTNG